MGVYTFTVVDETSTVAPARLFKALCLDQHNLFPKVVPQYIKSIDILEGDSTAAGCVKQYNFADGAPYKYLKGKVDEIDVNNFYIKYTNYEGDALGPVLECAVYESKVEPSGSESHYKTVGHFHTKGDVVITEVDVKGGIQGMVKNFKAIEEYLCNNPQVYA